MLRGLIRLIVLRLVPVLLLAAISWSGYQVVDAMVRQVTELQASNIPQDTLAGTATLIAGGRVALQQTQAVTPSPTETPSPTVTATDEPTVQPTSTNTPGVTASLTYTPTVTLTMTLFPTVTDTASPTATVTASNTISPTPRVIAQFQATNTPRSVFFATNTPEGAEPVQPTATAPTQALPTETPTMTLTLAPSATITIVPTETPTLVPPSPTLPSATAVPVVEATQPLPTPLFPQESAAGQIINGTPFPTSVPLVPRQDDLINIILLGGDDELSTEGYARTDTMIVVSINRDSNTVSMLSIPRDLFVAIPTNSGLMERINVVYDYGEAIGWTGGGFGLLRQTIFYNFGINVHYYARVNFTDFKEIIDTLGGVEIAVDCAYQDYELIGAEVPDEAVQVDEDGLRTLDVGYYEMNGAEALWYARTRGNSWDFDRGRRQQQLLRAIWRKGRDSLSVANAPQLWSQLESIVNTDLGFEEFVRLIPIALSLDVDRIRSYTLIRDYHTRPWQPPDGSFVQLPIYENLRPTIEDFYQAPPTSQLAVEGATIAVYNGTQNDDWDRVAAERLAWEGFSAIAMGTVDADSNEATVLIDRTGQQKGSSLSEIARALNVSQENIRIEPDPNRVADFEVILGTNYNSCDPGRVVPLD